MNTIVQHIETFWTKESRGNPGATVRNSVPDSFPVGNATEIHGVLLVEVKYSECANFKNPVVSDFRSINDNQQRQLGFKFEDLDSELVVSKWSYSGHLKKVGILKPGSWLRLIENERTSLENTWAYYKHVYNIYFGEAAKVGSSLSFQKPVTSLNAENNLW
ncbi:hypothetical protein [Pseudoalteromonas luteoviolacea]|uniref:Uncharacterized protein n=1 Tax=Pseudoalteromonas luteoviolacea S4060-1 TaxID=1365257 RepID=A0A167LXD1_9GAMM|nr:hypothetical protein [Pseudoalteromonas luteoviolacea]KZN65478.1 hypothetical protein N478_21320 [Pseudoalteromonas luteoviolacea S4060-1]